jgi:hypothetical protein
VNRAYESAGAYSENLTGYCRRATSNQEVERKSCEPVSSAIAGAVPLVIRRFGEVILSSLGEPRIWCMDSLRIWQGRKSISM